MERKFKFVVQKAIEDFVRGNYQEAAKFYQEAIEMDQGGKELLIINKIVTNFHLDEIASIRNDIQLLQNTAFHIFFLYFQGLLHHKNQEFKESCQYFAQGISNFGFQKDYSSYHSKIHSLELRKILIQLIHQETLEQELSIEPKRPFFGQLHVQ